MYITKTIITSKCRIKSKKAIIAISFILYSILEALSYNVSFNVVSQDSSSPLVASIEAEYGETSKEYTCDQNGFIQIECPDSINSLLINVQCKGYYPVMYELNPQKGETNLGIIKLEKLTVQLSEVVVSGSETILSAGKRIIIPS